YSTLFDSRFKTLQQNRKGDCLMTEYLQTLFISGMACLGCTGEIKYALEKNPSISVKKVNLEEGLVTIAAKTDLSISVINQLLENTKYKAL
ncbi:heavy-metal-associated domain-containing protein, partial [Enterococcus faecium]